MRSNSALMNSRFLSVRRAISIDDMVVALVNAPFPYSNPAHLP